MSGQAARLRLGEVLLLLDGELVTVVAPQWEPGIFFKHAGSVSFEVTRDDDPAVVRISTVGGPVPWEVLRVRVPTDRREEFEAFRAAVAAASVASRQ